MNICRQLAKDLREVYFGGNWTASNMKDNLSDVSWEEAVIKVETFNTIATLVYHTSYYIESVLPVMRGGRLDASDKLSFDHPPITDKADWDKLLDRTWTIAEDLATYIEQMPAEQLGKDFTDPKYGSYYRNLNGIIEHTHYHLGQLVLIKKIIRSGKK